MLLRASSEAVLSSSVWPPDVVASRGLFLIGSRRAFCEGRSGPPLSSARTSTFALTNATLPYALALADKGYRKALLDDANFREGLNIDHGKVTYKAVAEALGYDYTPTQEALKPWWRHADD